MKTECRFVVEQVTQRSHIVQNEVVRTEDVEMSAVTDTGKYERFTKATPAGSFRIFIDNPALMGFFEPGTVYRVVIDKAPE